MTGEGIAQALDTGVFAADAGGRPVVVASNRGPVSFVRDPVSGEVSARRGAGGLVTALGGALRIAGGTWIAAAMSDEDRAHALRGGADLDDAGFRLRSLAFDPVRYDDFYNSISNGVLWFTHHLLWEPARTPRFDERTFSAWESYRAVNAGFADAVAGEYFLRLRVDGVDSLIVERIGAPPKLQFDPNQKVTIT